MYTVPRNTRLLGKNLIFRPEVTSTNTLAIEFAKDGELQDGAVVITANQSAGKGQAGTIWSSEPSLNLTFSLYLERPLAAADAFFLNIITSLSITDLCTALGISGVQVKWPNDVLVSGKKISGILCENSIQGDHLRYAVIGIGLNVNQTAFNGFAATSMALESSDTFQLDQVFHQLLGCLELRLSQLRSGDHEVLRREWLHRLFLFQTPHTFTTRHGPLTGTITGIDPSGRLMVETDQGTCIFGPKEITP